jgi:hypothetical protein
MIHALCLAAALRFAPLAQPPVHDVTLTFDLGAAPIACKLTRDGWYECRAVVEPDRRCTADERALCNASCEAMSLPDPEVQPTWALVSRGCEVRTQFGRLTQTCYCTDPGSRA